MRRADGVLAIVGAVILASAITATTVVLVVHGSRAADPPSPAPNSVPVDLVWALYAACADQGEQFSHDGAFSSTVVDGRLRTTVVSSSARPDEIRTYEDDLNACYDGYRIEGADRAWSVGMLDMQAERLLAYDVAHRWLLPCLAARDMRPGEIPDVTDYLAPDRSPWYSYYEYYGGETSFDDLLAARHRCGSGSQPYEY